MTIIRATHDKEHPYFMIVRGVAQNKAISYEALGLLTYLLSKPDDWKIVPEDLKRVGCGRDKVYKLLKELEAAGHIIQKRQEAAQGVPPMWGERMVVEQPYPEMPDTEIQETVKKSPEMPDTVTAEYGETDTTYTDKYINTDHDKRIGARVIFNVFVHGGQDTYADGTFINPMKPDFQNECNAIFYAWYNELQALGRAPDTALETLWSIHREAALALAKNRRKPEDVAAYIRAMYTGDDAFWRNTTAPMKLAAVSNSIGNWLQSKKRVAPPEVVNAGQNPKYHGFAVNEWAREKATVQ